MAIHALSGYEGRNLIVKQRDDLYSCSFDLSDYQKMLGLLSDTDDVQSQIFKIKETLQTDNFERWIPAYFNAFIDNKSEEDERKLKKEIKAIQDIKRLMES
jgi:transcriptional regulator of heat shock response